MDPTRQLGRFFRYQAFLKSQISWKELNFEKATVLEIGCGPTLAWAPIAIYLGCKKYICVEPGLKSNFTHRDELAKKYFLPLFRELEGHFKKGSSFDEFWARLIGHVAIYSTPIEHCSFPSSSVDIVISNNVLQHVLDLDSCFTLIKEISHSRSRQFHKIHFTDHAGNPRKPFDAIYSIPPHEYFETQSLLNLKRPSEFLCLFEEHGLPVIMVPHYSENEISMEEFDRYWTRFAPRDLAVHKAFFVT